jgi:hypothetical protein
MIDLGKDNEPEGPAHLDMARQIHAWVEATGTYDVTQAFMAAMTASGYVSHVKLTQVRERKPAIVKRARKAKKR